MCTRKDKQTNRRCPRKLGQGRDVTGSKYLPPWRLATLSGPGIGHLASGEVSGWEAAGSRTGAEGDPSDGAQAPCFSPGVAAHLALPPRPHLGISR